MKDLDEAKTCIEVEISHNRLIGTMAARPSKYGTAVLYLVNIFEGQPCATEKEQSFYVEMDVQYSKYSSNSCAMRLIDNKLVALSYCWLRIAVIWH